MQHQGRSWERGHLSGWAAIGAPAHGGGPVPLLLFAGQAELGVMIFTSEMCVPSSV